MTGRVGWSAVLGAMLLAAAAPAWADAPPLPPAVVRATSPRGTCQAVATPDPARIVVQARTRPDHVLWSLPFWNPDLVLSDDCAVLGIGYRGGSLLELDERASDTTVMTFYRGGQVSRAVRLGELYPDLAVLPHTASHWLWRQETAWSGRIWTVHTVDGRTLAFTP